MLTCLIRISEPFISQNIYQLINRVRGGGVIIAAIKNY